MRKEWLARLLVGLLIGLAVSLPIYGTWQRSQGIVLHARMAETGGWTPENLTVVAGQPLHLRLTSDDVTHGFAVGQSDQPAVDVKPGEMTDVTLVFDKPGKYTFYCTRWCSVNHWRMRGTIEVTGPQSAPEAVKPPLYVQLGLDIDADHQAAFTPAQMPSAVRGALLKVAVPQAYTSREYYRSHTPAAMWQALRSEASLDKLSDLDVWDLVAWIVQSNTTPQELKMGQKLFTSNCAACHGEQGNGKGIFANTSLTPTPLPPGEGRTTAPSPLPSGEGPGMRVSPANFTDPVRMLSASPAHLQGKIIRGGMGTGMPYWGPIFTEDQTWALVAYLWTFQFEMEDKP